MSATVRPPPRLSAAARAIGACWTTVFESPVSITSVAIRIAPSTSTIRPPSTPERRFATGFIATCF
jgi:hypothetical protein